VRHFIATDVHETAPSKPSIIRTPNASNLLSVSVEPWQQDVVQGSTIPPYIVTTAANRRLTLFETSAKNEVVASLSELSDSPILSYCCIRGGDYQLITSMSGQLLLLQSSTVLDRRKDHTKYAIKVTAYEDVARVWVATAGWDAKVLIYCMTVPEGSPPSIGEPVATIKLATNPESILFVRSPESGGLMLLASRRDSTHLYYYHLVPPAATIGVASAQYECRLLGKQNLTPHSNAWIAFSPSCLALSPHDPQLLAIATSTLPHMRIMIVRLLFPRLGRMHDTSIEEIPWESENQVSQALAAVTLQNREDAAIVIQVNTFAPQTAFSTPQVVWRPDGSGVWVNGDDGVIRGIEAKTGKVASMLKDGHEAGSKVRSIWAGWVNTDKDEKEEWVLSGGFDKRLIIWRV
jgi:hypothetical protein